MDPKSKFYAEIEFSMYEKIKQNNFTFGFLKVSIFLFSTLIMGFKITSTLSLWNFSIKILTKSLSL
jgi:hypothetical protein